MAKLRIPVAKANRLIDKIPSGAVLFKYEKGHRRFSRRVDELFDVIYGCGRGFLYVKVKRQARVVPPTERQQILQYAKHLLRYRRDWGHWPDWRVKPAFHRRAIRMAEKMLRKGDIR
jgi:hypothetical protein